MRCTGQGRANAEDGFTLAELLLAIALLSLIAVILAGSLHFGRRAWEAADALQDRSSVSAVQTLLQQMLTQAMSTGVNITDETFVRKFDGGDDRLSFVTINSGRTTRGGLYEVSLGLIESDRSPRAGTRDVALVQTLFRPNPKDEARPRYERILLKDVASMHVRYFGSAAAGDAPDWHSAWSGKRWLPSLVAVAVEFPPGDRRTWPDLVVELKLR